ncbi:hypothetical protein [Stenotrophomonas sp. ATCM1_4]|uniref:phosphoribosyltransferase-like protein n=1 Tax=Stenotrophomonas sp. ATCM1_4 TaxID=2259330 RepID=UPI001FB73CCE|nr:hypothetical protein [Stenotrophomonas sp. ATCM1_4]
MEDLLHRVAATIATYRQGEIEAPTAQHVDRWLRQFTPENQLPFLREFSSVMGHIFVTRAWTIEFLRRLIGNQELSGPNPAQYWGAANILQIQSVGRSQQEMVRLLGESLMHGYGLDVLRCGHPDGDFIYLDDGIFSGSRAIADLGEWIRTQAPAHANLQIIVIALHIGGFYWVKDNLQRVARESGKNIIIKFWKVYDIENRRTYKNSSNVLWPATVPNSQEAQAYVDSIASTRFPLEMRAAGAPRWPFVSEEGRQILEGEFLIAGAKIKANMVEEKSYFRPLGFGSFGAGFGTMMVTYRNCPNNAPLALWWGDGGVSTPALNWYPLFKRRTNSSLENIFDDLTR